MGGNTVGAEKERLWLRRMNRELRRGVIKAGGEVSVGRLKVLMGIL